MGFEDLAKHMAARDGRKRSRVQSSNADEIVTAAIQADRRMNRTRDLVLGPLLLVGGLGVGLLVYSVLQDGFDTADPRNQGTSIRQSRAFLFAAGGLALAAIVAGLLKTIRGLTSRSFVGDAPEQILGDLEPDDQAAPRRRP